MGVYADSLNIGLNSLGFPSRSWMMIFLFLVHCPILLHLISCFSSRFLILLDAFFLQNIRRASRETPR